MNLKSKNSAHSVNRKCVVFLIYHKVRFKLSFYVLELRMEISGLSLQFESFLLFQYFRKLVSWNVRIGLG